jgi:protein-tyrosine phosphatase
VNPAVLYSFVFALLSGYLIVVAALFGGWAWLLLWPALSCALFSSAYAGLRHRVFAKRANGKLPLWSVLPLLPILLLLWGVWHVWRLISREPPCHEVVPGLWLGRRPFEHELPPGVVLVVDLATEFPAARRIRQGREYLSLPTLDGSIPDEELFRTALERVAAADGPVYVHCAQGHGRSALLAAAVLIHRGIAADVASAVMLLRAVRPSVRLNSAQRRFLERLLS